MTPNRPLRPTRGPLRSFALTALFMGAGLMPPISLAQPATADRAARVWAATCATCHSADQRTPGAIPLIGGRDAETLYRTLLEFKNGQRPAATVMHQHAKGYTDDELRRIAQVLATPPATR
ncbi:c-type cytochrome [Leptothrix discophora]|uniref:Class I cytochrome c n=1 Tax=Leptothrix discophora TaxID=89 RepID=A0ABT9G407_LEPDI|nr:c-type cytochrome [Leptothrix discophora]MDP4301224.1 class I cytochrome c [Leptothrix discophora]